jgi:hypothetical protein
MNEELDIQLKEGIKFEIEEDINPFDPREDVDSIWNRFICFHGKYDLGDDNDYDQDDYGSWSELQEAIEKREKPIALIPMYLYDHSGLRISGTPFGCEWDSGQIGFAYASVKTIDSCGYSRLKEESWNDFSKRIEADLYKDIDQYDLYISGQVYALTVRNKEDEVIESIGGFYGSDWEKNGIMDYLKPFIDTKTLADL